MWHPGVSFEETTTILLIGSKEKGGAVGDLPEGGNLCSTKAEMVVAHNSLVIASRNPNLQIESLQGVFLYYRHTVNPFDISSNWK